MTSDKINIEVRVTMPWAPEPIIKAVDVSLSECRDTLMPLPRERELIPSAALEAMMKRDFRNRFAACLARRLTTAIIEAAERRDPQFGYSPEEIEQWNER